MVGNSAEFKRRFGQKKDPREEALETLPMGARVNIGMLSKDEDTKEKVVNMMKPIISGWSENTINTNK